MLFALQLQGLETSLHRPSDQSCLEGSVSAHSSAAEDHSIPQSRGQPFNPEFAGSAPGLQSRQFLTLSMNTRSSPSVFWVWFAYLHFISFRKSLALSRWDFSVPSLLCCLSWSNSSSRWASWAWQPPPKQEEADRSYQGLRSVSDMQRPCHWY